MIRSILRLKLLKLRLKFQFLRFAFMVLLPAAVIALVILSFIRR